ncbi:MAG: dipicolinate synthase subunit B [Clostridia bacterium]|nr:dipicolinate synthase subunit B [Clostridia bacterium]
MIGYAFCGSFCTHKKSLELLNTIIASGYEVQPIMSETVYSTDTRFGTASLLCEKVRGICGREIIHTIVQAEPLGPKIKLDAMIISPCTGNTLAKIANGITDTAVSMAAKAHLRSNRPLVIALASNDALSSNLKNIGALLSRKSVYFVPMEQDEPIEKPHSLIADFDLLPQTLASAINGVQYQRVFK